MRIRIKVSTNKVGSECYDEFDIDDAEWNEMTEQEQADFCLEALWNSGMVDWTYEPV